MDVESDNILLDNGFDVRLSDVGIARVLLEGVDATHTLQLAGTSVSCVPGL